MLLHMRQAPTMPSTDTPREPVSVSGDEERPLSDARRNISGRSEQERVQARPLHGGCHCSPQINCNADPHGEKANNRRHPRRFLKNPQISNAPECGSQSPAHALVASWPLALACTGHDATGRGTFGIQSHD
jgi:hypothetical protein